MQRLLVILVALFSLSVSGLAATINYTANFNEKDFSIRETNKFYVVENPQCLKYGEIGAPQVLLTTLNFIIPPDQTIESIDINSTNSRQFPGEFDLFPVQPDAYYMNCCDMPVPDWVEPDSQYYNSNEPYPKDIAVAGGVGFFDGANHIATVKVFPVYYIAGKKELYFYENIDFIINLKSSIESPIRAQLRMRQDQQVYDDILSESVKNPQDIPVWGYQPPLSDTAILRPGPNDDPVYPFVIITRDSLVNYWAGYVDWLNRKGKRAGIITMEEIVQYNRVDNPALDDHANLLRGYLRYAYELGTVWVLLGGFSEPRVHGDIYNDNVNVPVRYLIDDRNTARGEITCEPCIGEHDYNRRCGWTAADIYYSDLTTDWEVDGDGYPGELGNNLEYCPHPDLFCHIDNNEELFLGRVPVLDGSDITRWTQKILNYEQNPGNGDYLYLSTAFWSESGPQNFEDFLGIDLFPGSFYHEIRRSMYPLSPYGYEVINLMSNYPAFVNWHHHGNYCEAALSYSHNPFAIASSLSARSGGGCDCRDNSGSCGMNDLTNIDKPGFLYACDCEQADFSCAYERNYPFEKKSIGSSYILENNGGVGFIGTSRHGWMVYSAALKANFLSFIFNSTNDIDHHKIGPAKAYWSTQVDHWDYLSNQTVLGSPEQLVWSGLLAHLTVIPDYGNDNVQVLFGGNPVSGARVCFASRNLTKYIVIESDNNGYATILPEYQFGHVDETMDITVTKHNYIPYQIIGSTPLIDNLTWRGDIAFYGDVEVSLGDTLVIKLGTTIRIKNAKLAVKGDLTIEGEATHPVTLTSVNTTPAPGDWTGLLIDEVGRLDMAYCRIEYAQDAVVAITGTDIEIRDCEIINSLNSAITAIYPETIRVLNSEFTDNNLYAINVVSAVHVAQFSDNTILGHHNIGIKYLGGQYPFTTNPIISGNRMDYYPGQGGIGIYIEKDGYLDTPSPQIISDTVRHFGVGILLFDTEAETYLGPGIDCNTNTYGLLYERAHADIIGSIGFPNSFSNNTENVGGNEIYGTVRRTKFENAGWGYGVEIANAYSMDFGQNNGEETWGNNSFAGNSERGLSIYESPLTPAKNNWWGTTDPDEIILLVTPECVDWNPFLLGEPLWKHRPDQQQTVLLETELFQAVPNPFNAESRIQFSLGQTAAVKLTIYNILGQEIKTLCDRELSPGSYSYIWDGRDVQGRPVTSGVYLYSLRTPQKMCTNKMVMLK